MEPEYQFKCPKCGVHRVPKTVFDAFVTPTITRKIRAMEGDVSKVRLVFTDGCPKCLPQGQTHTRAVDVEVAFKRKAARKPPEN